MAEKPHTPSQRAMLAGLAAAPVAGLPAKASPIAPLSQPLAVALESHRAAQAAYDACDEGDDQSSDRLFTE